MFKFLLPWIIEVPRPINPREAEMVVKMIDDSARQGYNRIYPAQDCYILSKTTLSGRIIQYINQGLPDTKEVYELGYNLEILAYEDYDSGYCTGIPVEVVDMKR